MPKGLVQKVLSINYWEVNKKWMLVLGRRAKRQCTIQLKMRRAEQQNGAICDDGCGGGGWEGRAMVTTPISWNEDFMPFRTPMPAGMPLSLALSYFFLSFFRSVSRETLRLQLKIRRYKRASMFYFYRLAGTLLKLLSTNNQREHKRNISVSMKYNRFLKLMTCLRRFASLPWPVMMVVLVGAAGAASSVDAGDDIAPIAGWHV